MGSLDAGTHPSLPSGLPQPWTTTPLVHSASLSTAASTQIYLKLENLQPSGSFKSRGVGNFCLQRLLQYRNQRGLPLSTEGLPEHKSQRNDTPADNGTTDSPDSENPHFYISSGGNAGLACVSAAKSLHCAATVVVPLTCSPFMVNKLRLAGASDVIQTGASWAEADRHLKDQMLSPHPPDSSSWTQDSWKEGEAQGKYYVPPFDHPYIWDGHSSMIHECPFKPDAIICSVGGGGLFAGIMQGLQQRGWLGDLDVLAVETEGAASLAASLKQGELVRLDKITSLATSLGATQVAERAFRYATAKGARVKSAVLSDADAVKGCRLLADEERLLVEPACGVNVAAAAAERGARLRKYLPGLTEESKVVVVVCGGSNVTVDMLVEWGEKFGT